MNLRHLGHAMVLLMTGLVIGCGENGDGVMSPDPDLDGSELSSARASGDCFGMIGDQVWLDTNGDGLRDFDEPIIPGAVVRLFDTAGTLLATTSVNGFGTYIFFSLCPGDYIVEVDESSLPEGLEPTDCNVGDDDTRDSECSGVMVTLTADHGADATIDFGYRPAPEGNPTACGPGFWRQEHHFDHWPSPYEPGSSLSAVIDRALSGDPTLYEALNHPGSGLRGLLFHGTAALLNAASAEVNYPLSVAEVTTLLQQAMDDGDYQSVKRVLADANDGACPLD